MGGVARAPSPHVVGPSLAATKVCCLRYGNLSPASIASASRLPHVHTSQPASQPATYRYMAHVPNRPPTWTEKLLQPQTATWHMCPTAPPPGRRSCYSHIPLHGTCAQPPPHLDGEADHLTQLVVQEGGGPGQGREGGGEHSSCASQGGGPGQGRGGVTAYGPARGRALGRGGGGGGQGQLNGDGPGSGSWLLGQSPPRRPGGPLRERRPYRRRASHIHVSYLSVSHVSYLSIRLNKFTLHTQAVTRSAIFSRPSPRLHLLA